jgi:hypothetical protein
MFFKSKPIGARYIQDVLLNSASSQQFGGDWEFLMGATSGKSSSESQDIIGDFIATLIGKKVIASCIYTFSKDKAKPKKNKELDKTFLQLQQLIEVKSLSALKAISSLNLSVTAVANRADLGLKYVLNTRDADVILYDESRLSTEYCLFRFKVMEEVPPSYLSKMFRAEISRYLGVEL